MDDFGSIIYWILSIAFIVYGAISSQKKKKKAEKLGSDFFNENLDEGNTAANNTKVSDMFDFLKGSDSSDETLIEEEIEVVEKDYFAERNIALEKKSNELRTVIDRTKVSSTSSSSYTDDMDDAYSIDETIYEYDDINWRQAIIHSEILNRKYF